MSYCLMNNVMWAYIGQYMLLLSWKTSECVLYDEMQSQTVR